MKIEKRNKLHLIIIILFLLIPNSILLGQVKMEAYFGVSGRDDGSVDIMEMYDKGYYISGGYDVGNYIYNGWNIKADVNLGYIYDKVLEHSTSTVAIFSSTSDSYGNIYITGFMEPTTQWPFITKIDSCGNKVWCKILQYDNEFEYGYSIDILISKNNEIILLASFDSEEEIDKLHLVGMNENGTVLWVKPYASKNDYPWIEEQNAYSLTEINNEYYISGFCYWPYPDDTTHMFLRPLFIGIDSLFNEKWILPFYALDSVFGTAYKSIPLNDSLFMGAGIRRAYDASNEDNALLMFYNINGEELGYANIDNDQLGLDVKGSVIRDIAAINDTMFITASLFGPEFGGNPGGEIVIDNSGAVIISLSKPNTSSASLIKTYDNNYVFATSIEENKGDDDIYVYKIDENLNNVPFDPTPHTYDSLCPGGIQPSTIDLSDCFVWTDIGEIPTPREYFSGLQTIPIKAYPNPANGNEVTFEFQNTQHHQNMQLKCFDVYGKQVHNERVYKYQGESIVNVQGWKAGIYLALVYSDNKVVGQTKLVVQ